MHLYFLDSVASNVDFERIDTIKKPSEEYKLIGKVFYLYAPDGIGKSKLAASVEKLLGVPATSRNWRTVTKLLAMLAE